MPRMFDGYQVQVLSQAGSEGSAEQRYGPKDQNPDLPKVSGEPANDREAHIQGHWR
jgi:hypothetical protein